MSKKQERKISMGDYPENDREFTEVKIKAVERQPDGTFAFTSDDGWSLWCGKEAPIKPREGMIARQYGRGIGSPVRGLFIDGKRFWYRTDAEDKDHREVELYGADAADWLRRWDEGLTCWTIEMGGMGPGYEQCIHITAAEILRWLLAEKIDADMLEADANAFKAYRERRDAALRGNETINRLGLSGAQHGAACNIAMQLYRRGPRAIMNDTAVKDRHIQVSKNFP